jgi:two-component system sensor histidine kinase BaeS
MRNKLFLAFLLVILTALVSSLLFERLIMKDFEEYDRGKREDRRYWLLATIEGGYQDRGWNMTSLADSIHWGMLLGFDIKVVDSEGKEILNSQKVMAALPPAMKRRMEAIIRGHSEMNEFDEYPLFSEGEEIGTLYVRPLARVGPAQLKEEIFMRRGKYFLIVSFLIAGAGAVAMAVFFSLSLSRPIKRLKEAAGRVAKGDFSVRVNVEPAAPVRKNRLLRSLHSDELKGLAECFNYMAEALEKQEALRKRLTSNITHELRTPVAVVRAQVEAMIDGVIENKARGLATISREIEKLTRLIEGIEDLTKAEASFLSEIEYGTLKLGEFLKSITDAMKPIFHEKGLGLDLIGGDSLSVVTDAEKLERIVKNILSNSLKYTEQGGVLIQYGREGKEGKEFFIDIRDTGRGISEEEVPRIFKRFYRGRDASDSGAGIGLAIVKELTELMRGRVDVRSSVGEGTTFRIWLPIK